MLHRIAPQYVNSYQIKANTLIPSSVSFILLSCNMSFSCFLIDFAIFLLLQQAAKKHFAVAVDSSRIFMLRSSTRLWCRGPLRAFVNMSTEFTSVFICPKSIVPLNYCSLACRCQTSMCLVWAITFFTHFFLSCSTTPHCRTQWWLEEQCLIWAQDLI